MSRPAWGARIEIRGLRSCLISRGLSRPARGAWIEIELRVSKMAPTTCRALYGSSGLKLHAHRDNLLSREGRAPYGARGLKCCD